MTKNQQQCTGARRARLSALGRSSFVTKSGIEALLKAVKKDGLPEAFSRSSRYRARKEMCSTATPYGKLIVQKNLKLINGKFVRLAFQNPLAIFHYNCNHSANYAQIVREALARYPSTAATPWEIIFCQDGVNPSDGLAKNHSRKPSVF